MFWRREKRLTSKQIVRTFTKKIHKDLVLICALDNFNEIRDLDKFISDFNEMRSGIPRLGLILISTSGNDLLKLLGKRLFFTLRIEALVFETYSLNELVEIMRARLKEAFGRSPGDELALFEIASFVKNTSQNVRHAFHILQDAIEMLDDSKLTVDIVREVIEKQMKQYKFT